MDECGEYVAGFDDADRRLDKVLRIFLPGLPLSAIYGALRRGRILVNKKKAAPSLRLAAGDRISLKGRLVEERAMLDGREKSRSNENELQLLMPYLVLACRDILFINKPRGMPSHGPGGLDILVREALAARLSNSLSFSPGPLHRLDRNTTGLIAFPRSAIGARRFTELLRKKTVTKRYLALLGGSLANMESWVDRLKRIGSTKKTQLSPAGREAKLCVAPLITTDRYSLALIELETGLTHQIRAQAAAHGFPLSGDVKYGGLDLRSFQGSVLEGGYVLHAFRLIFKTGIFPDVPLSITADLPKDSYTLLKGIFGEKNLENALERTKNG